MVRTTILPSYAYSQYADDDDIQLFIESYNNIAQQYLNTLVEIGLPLYPNLYGLLLDWIGSGLYGYVRPVLTTGTVKTTGPLNTYGCNSPPPLNQLLNTSPAFFLTSDDVYIRCLNWHIFKGDGKQFTIEWLKRRVCRFIWGPGQPLVGDAFSTWDYDVAHKYQVSVTFGANRDVDIHILNGALSNIGGALLNAFGLGAGPLSVPLNSITSVFTPYEVPALAVIFQEAVASGALELPFQFSWTVTIDQPPPIASAGWGFNWGNNWGGA